jgi:hypothetical protein
MGWIEDAEEALKKQLHTVKLKNLVSDEEPGRAAITATNRYGLLGKSLDVYGMVLTGIDILSTVQDAMNVTRSMHLLHETEMGLMSLEQSGQIARAANSTSVMGAGRFLFAANVFGIFATYIGVWLSLAGAWAAAKADILTDNAMAGVSRGAVLGANDAGPSYVGQNFWMFVKPSYPMYREAETAAKNIYNIALVAGYAQGKSLSRNQKGNLFRFIHARMTEGSRSFYSGDWAAWSPQTKKNYYIECAAIFRRELLR